MPKVRDIGKPGPANDKIGGVPTVYYYDFDSKGRGEVMRLFFEDAGIAFKDYRWSFDERNDGMNDNERAAKNPVGSVPYIDLNGTILTQSYSMLRYFARKLGEYDGQTDEERYFADVICDLVIDWRTKFVDSAFSTSSKGLKPNEDKSPFEHYKQYMVAKFAKGIEGQLASSPHARGGPYTLGKTITYADFVLWQMVHDDRVLAGTIKDVLPDCPRLSQLVEAVENRPRLKGYFASDRYYN